MLDQIEFTGIENVVMESSEEPPLIQACHALNHLKKQIQEQNTKQDDISDYNTQKVETKGFASEKNHSLF